MIEMLREEVFNNIRLFVQPAQLWSSVGVRPPHRAEAPEKLICKGFNQMFLLEGRTCHFYFSPPKQEEKLKTFEKAGQVWLLTSPCLSWNIVPASMPRLNNTWLTILLNYSISS